MASVKISAQKSGWMILQSLSGVALGWGCSKLQSKIGLVIPADIQAQVLAGWIVLATSAIHGAANYVKHVLKERVAVGPAKV